MIDRQKLVQALNEKSGVPVDITSEIQDGDEATGGSNNVPDSL
jgi:hypothetical protein